MNHFTFVWKTVGLDRTHGQASVMNLVFCVSFRDMNCLPCQFVSVYKMPLARCNTVKMGCITYEGHE
jgi:hypothetical protein